MYSTGFWQHNQDLTHTCRTPFILELECLKAFFTRSLLFNAYVQGWRSSGNIPGHLITETCLDKQPDHVDNSFHFLFSFLREHTCARKGQRGKEKIPSRLHWSAQCPTWGLIPRPQLWPEPKSRVRHSLNWLSTAPTPPATHPDSFHFQIWSAIEALGDTMLGCF